MKIIVKIFVSVGAIGLFSVNAQAAIYKCVNAQNKVYYIDKPCPKKDDETQFKAVKDPQNGYKPPVLEEEKVEVAKEGIVVGRDSSKLSTTQDNNGSKSTYSAEGGNSKSSNSSGGGSSASGADNVVSQSTGSNGSSEVGSSTISSLGEPKYDGLEPANVDDLIPATEKEQNLD